MFMHKKVHETQYIVGNYSKQLKVEIKMYRALIMWYQHRIGGFTYVCKLIAPRNRDAKTNINTHTKEQSMSI